MQCRIMRFFANYGGVVMKKNVLDLLVRCYENSRETVMILDENWQMCWCNHDPGLGYLPRTVGILEESWENCVKTFRYGDSLYLLSLLCNRTDGVRIATLRQPEENIIPVDTGSINNAISSVNAACNELYRRDPEDAKLINAIAGNCFKLYRPTYLQRMLDRRQAGYWEKVCFQVNAALGELKQKSEKVLGDLVDFELYTGEQKVYLEADREAFLTVMLSAIVLCYHKPEKLQELDIRLGTSGEMAVLTVTMEPTPEDREDFQHHLSDFGTLDGERMALSAFCTEYGGKWMLSRTGDAISCRIELPAAEPEKTLAINSKWADSECKFFNKYEVILARIHFRGFF